jgi:Cu2+-exporting ATPase
VAAIDRRIAVGQGVEGTIAGRRYRLGQPAFAAASAGGEIPAPPATGRWILLADTRAPLCWFHLDDRIRDDAACTVAALQRRGLQLHELSGDTIETVATLARHLSIEHSAGGATPEQKLQYIASLQRAGRRVLMIGDGINDLPVLAAADVSVAMSDASGLAKTSADCILLTPRLDRLPQLLDTAILARRIVRENLGWALFYNAVALPLAMAGLVPPWLAAIGMSASSLFVVGNTLRLQLAARER